MADTTAIRFAKGSAVWCQTTPVNYHDATVVEDCVDGDEEAVVRYTTCARIMRVAVEKVIPIGDERPTRRAAAPRAPAPAPGAAPPQRRHVAPLDSLQALPPPRGAATAPTPAFVAPAADEVVDDDDKSPAAEPAAADDEPVAADDDEDDEPPAADAPAAADLAADAPFPVGAQVEARFQGGEKFYLALVVAVLGDGRRVDLLYCDGDAERGVSVDLVRPLARRRRTPVSALAPAAPAPAPACKKKPKRAKAPVLVAAPAAPVSAAPVPTPLAPAVVSPPAKAATPGRDGAPTAAPRPRPGREAVGRRVRVWWPDDVAWYTGSVVSYDSARHAIKYDDGDEEALDLSREKHEFLAARPPVTPRCTHRGAPTRCYAKGSPQNRGARAGATSSSDDSSDDSSDSSDDEPGAAAAAPPPDVDERDDTASASEPSEGPPQRRRREGEGAYAEYDDDALDEDEDNAMLRRALRELRGYDASDAEEHAAPPHALLPQASPPPQAPIHVLLGAPPLAPAVLVRRPRLDKAVLAARMTADGWVTTEKKRQGGAHVDRYFRKPGDSRSLRSLPEVYRAYYPDLMNLDASIPPRKRARKRRRRSDDDERPERELRPQVIARFDEAESGEWLTSGSPWVGRRLMRTVFDYDEEAARRVADIAYEPGGTGRVAVDQCACFVVGWLPPDISEFRDAHGRPAALYRVRYEDGDLAGDEEDFELHELEDCQGQAKEIDAVPDVVDASAVLKALRSVDVTALALDLRRNVRIHEGQRVRSIPIGAIGRGTGAAGVKVSEETRNRPRLARLLAEFGRRNLPPDFPFTSIQVNADYRSAMHIDYGNQGASAIAAFGEFSGGDLWTHDRGRVRVGGDRRGAPQFFNGNMPHMILPFEGERYSLIYFCCGNWGSLSAEDEAELRRAGFPMPARPASPHCGPSEPRPDRAFRRHAFPTPRKAFEYEYGFQVHEDHILASALTNYKTWCARRGLVVDAVLDEIACRIGADETDVARLGPGGTCPSIPGLVLGATARLSWACFGTAEGTNMANERVPWRHRKQALGGAVLYAEQISGRWLFGVFYDDGDFEELDVDGLANRGPPTPYVVYEGFQDRHRVISHLPHPNLASIADAVDAPALARAALAADPALPGVVDRQRAGKTLRPGRLGRPNLQRVPIDAPNVGGLHMRAAGLLPAEDSTPAP